MEEAGGSNPPNSTTKLPAITHNHTNALAEYDQLIDEIEFMMAQNEPTRAIHKYLRFLDKHYKIAVQSKDCDNFLYFLSYLPTLIDRWGLLPEIREFLMVVMEDIDKYCNPEYFNKYCRMLLYFNSKIENKAQMEKFEKLAIEYFLNDKNLASDRCSILNHLGYHLSEQKRYREAEEVFKRCLDACETYNLPSSVKYVPQLNLASVYYEQDKTDEAFHLLVSLFRHHDFAYTNPHLVNIARIYLGKVEVKRGNIAKAIGHLIVARELASKYELFADEVLALQSLVKLYHFIGDKFNTYRYAKDLVAVVKYANFNPDNYSEYFELLKELEPEVGYLLEDRQMHEALHAIEFVDDYNKA